MNAALAQVQAWIDDNAALLAERPNLIDADVTWAKNALTADYGFVFDADFDAHLLDVLVVLMAQSLPGPGTVADLANARIDALAALHKGAQCSVGYAGCTGTGTLGTDPGAEELYGTVDFVVLCDHCAHQTLRDT